MSRTRVQVGAVLVVALFLRVLNLNGRAMWYDEAFAVLYAEKSFAQMWYGTVTLVQGAAADIHPLFYYSLLHGWMDLVGESPFAVRFFSVALSVGTIAVVYRLTYVLFAPGSGTGSPSFCAGARRADRIALAAATVLAVSPFAIAYGQEARMYALMGFTSALLVLAYQMVERGQGRKWWVILVAGGAAMLYSHNLAVFFGAALAVWILACSVRRKTRHMLIRYVAAGIAIFGLWLPGFMLIPSQVGKIQQAYWISSPNGVSVLQTLLTFTVDFDNARLPPLLLPFALASSLLVISLLILEVARAGRQEAPVAFLVVLALLAPVLIFAVSLWRPVYLTRALMPSFLMLAILVAWLFQQLPGILRWGLVFALGAITLMSLVFYYSYGDFPRPPFSEALSLLYSRLGSNDIIVHDNKLSFFPMFYYARSKPLPQHFVQDPTGSASDTLALPTQQALGIYGEPLDAAVGSHSRVWFVMFQEARDEAAGASNLEWMRAHYPVAREWKFNDLELYLFEE